MKSHLPKGILSVIFTLSVFSVLLLLIPHQVYGDGFAMENLPPATVGDKKVSLFIQLNPTVITTNTDQQRYLLLRVFDANTNETLKHDSLQITVTKASNEQQVLMRDLFHTHSGVLTLTITPTTDTQWTVYGDEDPVLGWSNQGDTPIPVMAPILGEGGLYHIHIELISYLNDKNTFAVQDIPKFDSYLSVGDISNHTLSYNGNSYNSEIISYYDKLNSNFNFAPSKLQVSFSMPFDWNTSRFQDRPIFVHEEVHIPKSFKEFTSTPTYVASVNGDPITGRRLIVDPYSLGDTVIAHILLNKIDIENLAKTIPPGTNTMDFQLAPAAANVQTSSSVLTDFGGWGINLGWSPTQITANTQNNLKLTFFDAFTEKQVMGDVNYDIKILDNDGNTAISETGLTAKGGVDTQSINLPSNGVYRIEINIKSIINNGIPDTSRIGIGRGDLVIPSTVTSDTSVQPSNNTAKVPEFGPIASLILVIAIVSVVAVTAKTRLR
jgi:predicted secreted protein with PEFG-CTERM motif